MSTDGSGPAGGAAISLASQGEHFSALGMELNVRMHTAQTAGAFDVGEAVFPPGGGFPPHFHDFEEAVYFLRGAMQMTVGSRRMEAATGCCAYIPHGVVHAFANRGSQPCTLLLLFLPSYGPGLADFSRELSQLPADPDPVTLSAIFQRYETHVSE